MKKMVIVLILSVFVNACSMKEVMKSVEEAIGETTASGGKAVTKTEIIAGLKQALEVGISKGAVRVSKTDGYFKNPKIKIPLPPDVKKVEQAIRNAGLGKDVDRILLNINRGAEDAAKSAKPIFVSAIKKMTFQDVMGILKGSNNAATQYLQKTTSSQLRTAFKPVIKKSLDKVQATKHWGDLVRNYNKIAPVLGKKKVNPDLNSFVTGKALEGLFYMVAKEEAKIRKDPIARTTELLRRVFKLQDN